MADIDDCVAVARWLADSGRVDRRKMAIRGGSAGGLTALGALVRSDVFAAAVSWYGVTDLISLAATTHDFESRYTDRLIGPLVSYDQRHRAELLPTLREFLGCSGSWNSCATRMSVHVNTVLYRIRRIEELTGRDLSCLDDQVDFFLALRVR